VFKLLQSDQKVAVFGRTLVLQCQIVFPLITTRASVEACGDGLRNMPADGCDGIIWIAVSMEIWRGFGRTNGEARRIGSRSDVG
jgi:hypothetical protein